MFISPLSLFPPPPLFRLSHRAAQQSWWPVHVPPSAPASPAAPRLHLRSPGTLHSGQPAEEDHANAVPSQPGQPGGRHWLEHGPGSASQQLGAQQQHPLGDQVTECRSLIKVNCVFISPKQVNKSKQERLSEKKKGEHEQRKELKIIWENT